MAYGWTTFDTILNIINSMAKSSYRDDSKKHLSTLFTRIQKIQTDIITMYNADELTHHEYNTLYAVSNIVRDEFRSRLREFG